MHYDDIEPNERTWLEGFLMGLLYAQAHADRPSGNQTLSTHLPDEWWDFRAQEWKAIDHIEDKLQAIRAQLDDGGVTAIRFRDEIAWYNGMVGGEQDTFGPKPVMTRVMDVAGSEGFHGMPDWEN